jgi:hypothetical protein
VQNVYDQRSRDAYWLATRIELKSIQRRGDVFVLIAAGVLLALLAFNREKSAELNWWLAGGGLLLFVISTSLWFVTKRRRSVAAARGLVCRACGYMPHDTEISEVAETRQCSHCASSLDG